MPGSKVGAAFNCSSVRSVVKRASLPTLIIAAGIATCRSLTPSTPPLAMMTLILIGYLVLGTVMESFAVMIITVPIITPLVTGMGYDVIWWGIAMLCVVETGMIHPPFGINVFVLKGITPDVSLWTIYKGVTPFVIADLVKLVLL